MRILLIGAGGQLAEDLRRTLARDEVVSVCHAELEIADGAAVQQLLEQTRPACILNTAAFNLVDVSEDDPEQAFRTNTLGAFHLARAAQQTGAALAHFSTNYVFDGAKRAPYVESDSPRPLSVYGASKFAGEWAAQRYCEKHFVVRTAALFGVAGRRNKRGNFLERLIRLAEKGKPVRVVDDQIINPTGTRDLAEKVALLIQTPQYGLYHMTNTGECSWYELAREAFRRLGLEKHLTPVSTETLGAKARRPAYSAMENAALRPTGLGDFRPWQEALDEYISDR